MSAARRVPARLLALLLMGLILVACGVPTGGPPEPIPASSVPFGLASPSRTAPPADVDPTELDEPRVHLVEGGDALVPRAREVPAGPVPDRLGTLLADLAAGPTDAELAAELGTALPPGVRLSVTGVSGGTATVDLTGAADSPSGREGRRAVAQIVLTATSVSGVSSVLLTRDGTPVEAPLPSGELTSAPLTAADYAPLLTAPPS